MIEKSQTTGSMIFMLILNLEHDDGGEEEEDGRMCLHLSMLMMTRDSMMTWLGRSCNIGSK